MIRKTILAAAATALSFGSLAATTSSASAGNWGYGHQTYSQPSQVTVIRYQPIYKTVCQPLYKTVQVWDAYYCRWVSQVVFVRNDCWQVQIY